MRTTIFTLTGLGVFSSPFFRSRQFLLWLMVGIFILTCGMFSTPVSVAQETSLPLEFQDVVLFATHNIQLKKSVEILSGDVVVNDAENRYGGQLKVGSNVTTPADFGLVGHNIKIDRNAVVGGDVYYNRLRNKGTIDGNLTTPISLPVYDPLPPFKLEAPGSQNITVNPYSTQVLPPGDYSKIQVKRGAP